MSEIESLISKYNVNPENAKLVSYYEADNIWKTLRIERDENSHSAFLKWLLDIKCVSSPSPLQQFLNILVKNARTEQIDKGLKNSILLNTLTIGSTEIFIEKSIPDISVIRYADRLDLYLRCEIIGEEPSVLEIFIENKVCASEGGGKKRKNNQQVFQPTPEELEYSKLSQTQKYYYACSHECGNRKSKDETIQLFVFLSPQNDKLPVDEHYITVTYQDLVNYILEPQLNRGDMDNHMSFIIKDYLRNLTKPMNCNYAEMATTEEERDLLLAFFDRNKELFLRAGMIAKEYADTEEERVALSSLVASLNTSTRAKNRFFSINGIGKYRMYEVIARFVKFRNGKKATIPEIDSELRGFANQKNRCVVSSVESGQDGVYRNDLHFHCDKFDDGSIFYVTKELGMGEEGKNFDGIFNSINKIYGTEFKIEQI